MIKHIGKIKALAKILDNKEIFEAIDMLSHSEDSHVDIMEPIAVHAIKSLSSKRSLSLSEIYQNKEAAEALVILSKFNALNSKSLEKKCIEMAESAQKSFDFLTPVSSESTLDSIYDSLSEFSNMSFESYVTSEEPIIVCSVFHDKEESATSVYDAISQLDGKPYGFYLFKIISNLNTNYVDPAYKTTRYLVSHQNNGNYFAKFKISKEKGASLYKMIAYRNAFFTKRRFEQGEESTELVQHKDKDSLYHSFGQKTLYGISFLCSLISSGHSSIFDYKLEKRFITFNNDSKSTEIALREDISENIKPFTLEDLKFTGDFECLSYLDDRYEDRLQKDIELINFHNEDDVRNVFVIHYKNHENNEHEYQISKLRAVDSYHGYAGNHAILRSIPKLSVFEDTLVARERLRQFALQNKISLIRLYQSKESHKIFDLAMAELQSLAINNIDTMINQCESKDLLWVSGAKKRWMSDFGSRHAIIAWEDYHLVRRGEEYNSYPEFTVLRNYKNKFNASNVIYYQVDTLNEILEIAGKSIEELPENLQHVLNRAKASEYLNQYSKDHNLQILCASDMDYDISRPEMSLAFTGEIFKVAIPVTKSEFTKLTENKERIIKMY